MASFQDLSPRYIFTERLVLERYDHGKEHGKCLDEAINNKTAVAARKNNEHYTVARIDELCAKGRLRSDIFKDGVADGDCIYLLRLKPGENKLASEDDRKREVVGYISVFNGTSRGIFLQPDVGWAMLEAYMGCGYATEAAAVVVDMCERNLNFHNIVVFFRRINPRSNRVAAKIGYEPAGQVLEIPQDGGEQRWKAVWVKDRVRLDVPEDLYRSLADSDWTG